MNLTYRKLNAIDSIAYREIRLESLKLHPESFGASYEEQKNLPKLRGQKTLEQPVDAQFLIGAYDGDDLIGICVFLPFLLDGNLQLNNVGTIVQMYVKASHRGNKVGLNLINAVIQEVFKHKNLEQIILEVWDENVSAIRIYEQAGFQLYKPEDNALEGYKDSILMLLSREG